MATPGGSGTMGTARQYLGAAGAVGLTTAVGFTLRSSLNPIDIAMLYLLAVVAVSATARRGPALLATLLGIAAFDFVFVPPYYTFDVHDTSYFLTFGVMLAVALVMSGLTGRIREQAEEARERAARTTALYALDRDLAQVGGSDELVAAAAQHLTRAVPGEVIIRLVDEGREPIWPSGGVFEDISTRVAAEWAFERGEAAGRGTSHAAEAEALALPLRTPLRTMGVAVLRPEPTGTGPLPAQLRTAEALAEATAAALERATLAEGHQSARMEVEEERLRTSLLSSLSHDMRTPLSSIEGAASSLLEDAATLPAETRRDLAETILVESRRMHQLVANLLDMVRVESGALGVQKSWQPLEEPLGVALLRLEDRLKGHPVRTELAPDLTLVPCDELLIEQVFINLLENAAKYTPPGTPILVKAWVESGQVVVEVSDRGPGIPTAEREQVFQKFYRAAGADGGGRIGGTGLGLTICRGIVLAHGGRIWVDDNPGGGAAFRFTLPLEGRQPEALPADPAEGP
jgi:two-component system sensor histidine kinase KdpD